MTVKMENSENCLKTYSGQQQTYPVSAQRFEARDSGGATLQLKKLGERIHTPRATAEQWYGIQNIEGRSDDVLVLAYSKSGMHLAYEIVRMLRQGNAEPIQNVMEVHHLDFLQPKPSSQIESPRTLCSHRYLEELPRQMVELKCKIVQIFRNPKDVCVSLYHHLRQMKNMEYTGIFSDFISLFTQGIVPFNSYEDYYFKWKHVRNENPTYPHYSFKYEDLLANPVKEIRKLAEFLEVPYSDILCFNIAENIKFDKMKQQKESLHNPFVGGFITGKDIMYRHGKTGDWRNHFSAQEAESFDQFYSEKLGKDYEYLK